MYQEGLVRFASVNYSHNLADVKNRFIHLTNYSVNKKNKNLDDLEENFEKTKDKTKIKWTFKVLKEYFKKKNYDYNSVFSQIEDIIVKTIISVEGQIVKGLEKYVPYRNNCF